MRNKLLRKLAEDVFSSGMIPVDWEESFILNLYKGKGEALGRANYRGLKLTDRVMKLLERVLDSSIRQMVNIDEMQFCFVPSRGATDAIFSVSQLQEDYITATNKWQFCPWWQASISVLSADVDHICPLCKGESRPINGSPMTQVDVKSTKLDVEATFCYLDDMPCSGGGYGSAIAARCSVVWGKFRKLLPVLSSTHLSPKVHGRVHMACVGSAILHGNEKWWPNILDLKWICRNNHAMIRWICGTKVQDETPSASLLKKFGINDITAVHLSGRLRWYGHVQRATPCIKSVTDLPLPGSRGKRRPRKTWSACVRTNIRASGLAGTDPQDRDP